MNIFNNKMNIFILLFSVIHICQVTFGSDPDDTIPTCELVMNKGYPCQEHNVTTSDGYILTVHRIPYGRKSPGNNRSTAKRVVYLQHGLLDCSSSWVINFPNQSLGFLLADAGYDVWLGNMRGNTYALNHLSFTIKEDRFWRFTFDQMAKYDLPAIVEFALATSGQRFLYYVGHSQGTAVGFIKFIQDRAWAKGKIRQFHALAPITWIGRTTSPLQYIAPFADNIAANRISCQAQERHNSYTEQCVNRPPLYCAKICLFYIPSRTSVYMTHSPAGTSTYNMVHFAQLAKSRKFQSMDWGSAEENERYYNSSTPVEYKPSLMTIPTAIYWGDKDVLAHPDDVQALRPHIRNLLGSFRYSDFDHADFIWGLNAPNVAYPELMRLIAKDVATLNVS